jgi:hypothetical protein
MSYDLLEQTELSLAGLIKYSILEPMLSFLHHIRYKYANPSSRVAVNQDHKCQLNPVSQMDENRIFVGPVRDKNIHNQSRQRRSRRKV